MRDSLLAVSGRLDQKISAGRPTSRGFVEPPPDGYGFIDRQNLPNLSAISTLQSRHDQPAALYDGGSAAGAVHDEQPVHRRAGPRPGQSPGIASATVPQKRIEQMYRILFGRAPVPRKSSLVCNTENESQAGSKPPATGRAALQYGYGGYDEGGASGKFSASLTSGGAWQGGPNLPIRRSGCLSNAQGGHPGESDSRGHPAGVDSGRRMHRTITGTLRHPEERGDGVRGSMSMCTAPACWPSAPTTVTPPRIGRSAGEAGGYNGFHRGRQRLGLVPILTWPLTIQVKNERKCGRRRASFPGQPRRSRRACHMGKVKPRCCLSRMSLFLWISYCRTSITVSACKIIFSRGGNCCVAVAWAWGAWRISNLLGQASLQGAGAG